MAVKKPKPTAVSKIERSQLSPKTVQRELMGDDLDLQGLLIYLRGLIRFDAIERVTDIQVERTIEGASTLIITLLDPDRAVLRSGFLNSRLDVQVDGLWFRLVKVEKQSDNIILTFEDREVAVLRTYNKFKLVQRANATRAEFVVNLLNEVKEFKGRIPHVIPELHHVQPIEKSDDISSTDWDALLDKNGGLNVDLATGITTGKTETNKGTQDQTEARGVDPASQARKALTAKGKVVDQGQINVANQIIATAVSLGARRKLMVAAVCTSIVESVLHNNPDGDGTSVGTFQQTANGHWGSFEDRMDIPTATRMFLRDADKIDKAQPNIPIGQLCQAVQVSAYPERYALYVDEANRFVSAYGIPGGMDETSAATANNSKELQGGAAPSYIFYRGEPINGGKTWKKEDSWKCIQRLAEEVQWRAFFVSGVFYFMSEDDLFKSLPIAVITESSDGVEAVDGDYDSGKKSATVTITARVGTWLVPPGAVITLQDMGPWNGRWLVTAFSRSLFDSRATITLKKPLPKLPEPAQNDINDLQPSWATPAPSFTDDPATVTTDMKNTADASAQVVQYIKQGKFRFDNKTHPDQFAKAAKGQKLRNQCGRDVVLNAAIPNAIIMLVENGYGIGIFALCEDHHCNAGQHPLGQAMDISSIWTALTGWRTIGDGDPTTTRLIMEVMKLLQPVAYDIIMNGNGREDSTVQALQMDNGQIRGGHWEGNHTNHIHCGVAPSPTGVKH